MGKTKLERLGMLTWMIKLYRTQGSDYYKSQVTFGEKEGWYFIKQIAFWGEWQNFISTSMVVRRVLPYNSLIYIAILWLFIPVFDLTIKSLQNEQSTLPLSLWFCFMVLFHLAWGRLLTLYKRLSQSLLNVKIFGMTIWQAMPILIWWFGFDCHLLGYSGPKATFVRGSPEIQTQPRNPSRLYPSGDK